MTTRSRSPLSVPMRSPSRGKGACGAPPTRHHRYIFAGTPLSSVRRSQYLFNNGFGSLAAYAGFNFEFKAGLRGSVTITVPGRIQVEIGNSGRSDYADLGRPVVSSGWGGEHSYSAMVYVKAIGTALQIASFGMQMEARMGSHTRKKGTAYIQWGIQFPSFPSITIGCNSYSLRPFDTSWFNFGSKKTLKSVYF